MKVLSARAVEYNQKFITGSSQGWACGSHQEAFSENSHTEKSPNTVTVEDLGLKERTGPSHRYLCPFV